MLLLVEHKVWSWSSYPTNPTRDRKTILVGSCRDYRTRSCRQSRDRVYPSVTSLKATSFLWISPLWSTEVDIAVVIIFIVVVVVPLLHGHSIHASVSRKRTVENLHFKHDFPFSSLHVRLSACLLANECTMPKEPSKHPILSIDFVQPARGSSSRATTGNPLNTGRRTPVCLAECPKDNWPVFWGFS